MELNGINGINVYSQSDDNSHQISLDSDTRDLLEYIREIRQMSNHYTGFNFATNLLDIEEDVNMMKTWYLDEIDLRENNPAVKAAWEHYQTMMTLAKQDKDK
jgi:hypothetical protein